jgi:hypothetical protein
MKPKKISVFHQLWKKIFNLPAHSKKITHTENNFVDNEDTNQAVTFLYFRDMRHSPKESPSEPDQRDGWTN